MHFDGFLSREYINIEYNLFFKNNALSLLNKIFPKLKFKIISLFFFFVSSIFNSKTFENCIINDSSKNIKSSGKLI